MNLPQSSLRAFLSTAKNALRNAAQSQQRVNFVIGNESADLDSITSSLLYAYLHSTPPTYLLIPLLNIPRSDLSIRPELLHLLPHANLTPDHLITLSDLPAPSSLPPSRTSWILVDHNALQPPLGPLYGGHVGGCIDHHSDEGAVALGATPRVIEVSGSCTSLVVNYCREAWDRLSRSASASAVGTAQGDAVVGGDDAAVRKVWDAQVARLAIASILVDTSNMRDNGKVTDHDVAALEYLEAKILNAPGQPWDRDGFFERLQHAKGDLEGLSVEDVFRKDFKAWEEGGRSLGVSSCVKTMGWLGVKAGGQEAFLRSLESFAEDRKLAVYAVMTTSTSAAGGFQRELLLWVRDREGCEGLLGRFEEASGGELRLEDWDEDRDLKTALLQPEREGMRIWWQRAVDKSRKQVAPLLRAAMR